MNAARKLFLWAVLVALCLVFWYGLYRIAEAFPVLAVVIAGACLYCVVTIIDEAKNARDELLGP